MESYDAELAEINKDKIEMILDGFLHNMRLLGNLTCSIAKDAIKKDHEDSDGKLISEDERKCAEREKSEQISWVNEKINGRELSNYEIQELVDESKSKIHKYRFSEALIKLESYLRLSYILDKGSYSFSKFFEKEEDEPMEETLVRQAFTDEDNDEKRIGIRHSTMCKFIQYSHPYWPVIQDKNISFLMDHLSTLFPNSEFTDKLEIIYGKNDEHKKYISSENLERVWKLIHACIKTSVKYMKYIGRANFKTKEIVNGEEKLSHVVNVDIEEEIVKWKVNWTEVRPVRKT